jgi:uncharacterized protein involved in exopolysaccharide biosynthesis/Mrp family chromosome partitioning ATPase
MGFDMQAGVSSTGRPGAVTSIDELDLGALGRAVWRKRSLILILTIAAAAVAFAAVNLISPRYRSEARVLIETRDNIFLRPEAEKTLERGTTVDQEAVTSQVQLILSRDLARDVIKKLKLGERPEFDPALQGSSVLRVLLGIVGIGKDPMSMTPEERVLKAYFARLSAFQVEKSRVIAIEFESQDPELAARVTNAIAEGYLALQRTAKQEQTRAASQWLAGEIESLRRKGAEAEARVEQYRSKTNLFVGTNNTMLSNQQLGDSNAQLSTARAQKSDAQAKARIIRDALRAGGPVEFSDIINSELMRRLSEQRVMLRAQLAEQSSTLLDQHPRIKELRAQIADLERQMRLEAERLARSFENDAKLAAARVETLQTNFDQLKHQAASTNEQDVQLRALERDAKSQRDLLESYLAKYREASARDNIGAASAEARIISTAIVSNTPAWPKKLPTVLVAALGTFALSVGFVLTGELLGGTTTLPRARVPLEEKAEPSPLAERARRAVVGQDAKRVDSAPAPDVPLEGVEQLAHELAAAGETGRRVAVIGAQRNSNAALAAITLARALAQQSRVVLMDLALNAPSQSAIAADPGTPGIAELVAGAASFGEIITRDRLSRVHVVTAGRLAGDADAVLASRRVAITIEALARSYDHVVINAGALPDTRPERLAQFASRAVIVDETADAPAAVAARQTLEAAGFSHMAVLASPVDVAGAARAAA